VCACDERLCVDVDVGGRVWVKRDGVGWVCVLKSDSSSFFFPRVGLLENAT